MKTKLIVPILLAIGAVAGAGFAYLHSNNEAKAELEAPVEVTPITTQAPLPRLPELPRTTAICKSDASCWRQFAEIEWALAQMHLSPYRKAVSEKTCKNADDLKCWKGMFTAALAMNDAAEAMSNFDSSFTPIVSVKTP